MINILLLNNSCNNKYKNNSKSNQKLSYWALNQKVLLQDKNLPNQTQKQHQNLKVILLCKYQHSSDKVNLMNIKPLFKTLNNQLNKFYQLHSYLLLYFHHNNSNLVDSWTSNYLLVDYQYNNSLLKIPTLNLKAYNK